MCNIVRSASFLDVVAAPKNSNLKNRREQQRTVENSREPQRTAENSRGEQVENSKVRQRKAQTGLLEVIVFKTTDNFRLKPMMNFFSTPPTSTKTTFIHNVQIGSSELQKGIAKGTAKGIGETMIPLTTRHTKKTMGALKPHSCIPAPPLLCWRLV